MIYRILLERRSKTLETRFRKETIAVSTCLHAIDEKQLERMVGKRTHNCYTSTHIFCFCMLHTYDKQYSVYAFLEVWYTRKFHYPLLQLLFDVLFRYFRFPVYFCCVAIMRERIIDRKKKKKQKKKIKKKKERNQTERTRYSCEKNTLCS